MLIALSYWPQNPRWLGYHDWRWVGSPVLSDKWFLDLTTQEMMGDITSKQEPFACLVRYYATYTSLSSLNWLPNIGFWRLKDKIGMSLDEIHISGGVPHCTWNFWSCESVFCWIELGWSTYWSSPARTRCATFLWLVVCGHLSMIITPAETLNRPAWLRVFLYLFQTKHIGIGWWYTISSSDGKKARDHVSDSKIPGIWSGLMICWNR